jgi:hypothetical protein
MSGFITDHIKECCVCLAPVDTREETEGGDPEGCQIDDAKWVCSRECWADASESKEGKE